jgi:hypothetical protein
VKKDSQTVFLCLLQSKRHVGVLLAALNRHLSGDLTFGVSGLMSDLFNIVFCEIKFALYQNKKETETPGKGRELVIKCTLVDGRGLAPTIYHIVHSGP